MEVAEPDSAYRAGSPLPVDQAPGFALRAAEQFRSAVWRRIIGTFPSTPLYAMMLAMRAERDQHQQIIADRIAVDKATATSLIHQLERHGLAARRPDAEDGRRRTVSLNSGADVILEEVTSRLPELEAELLHPLTAAEREEVAEIWRLTSRTEERPTSGTTSRLDDYLQSSGWLLRRTRQVHSQFWDEKVPLLTPPQYSVLDVLYFSGPLEVLVTARRASLEESNGARLLSRLTTRGLLVRSPDKQDGRRILLKITGEGKRALRSCSPGVRGVQEALVSPLSADSVERFHFLTSMVARLRPASRP